MTDSHHLTFRLADLAFDLSSPQIPFELDWAASPVATFLQVGTPVGPPSDRIQVGFHPGSVPDLSAVSPVHCTNRLLTWYRSGPQIWLRWEHPLHPEAFWLAEISASENRVEVCFTPEMLTTVAAAPPSAEPGLSLAFLSNVYRLLSVVFLAPRQGLLHHTTAALFGGRLWLFPGRSGIGKSTLARLLAGCPEFQVIGDDSAATRYWDARQSGGATYRAYGTPWPSSAGFAVNAAAPLGGLLFLHQSAENRLEPLSQREALHRLLPATNLFWWHPEWMPAMLEGCDRLIRTIPAWQFSFAPTPDAVETLADFLPSEGGMR